MRSRLLGLLLASATLAPSAYADTYQFTFNGVFQPNVYVGSNPTPPNLSFSWQLSGLPTSVFMYPYYSLQYTNTPITPNPFVDQANLVLYSYASMGTGRRQS